MSLPHIRVVYGVPAKRGTRAAYLGNGCRQMGTIVGSRGSRLRIRLDGEMEPRTFHPTWMIEYPKEGDA